MKFYSHNYQTKVGCALQCYVLAVSFPCMWIKKFHAEKLNNVYVIVFCKDSAKPGFFDNPPKNVFVGLGNDTVDLKNIHIPR